MTITQILDVPLQLALQVPAVPLALCEQLNESRKNAVLAPESYHENSKASRHQPPNLLPLDLIDCEPTLAELNFCDDLDALYMDTSMHGNAYNATH